MRIRTLGAAIVLVLSMCSVAAVRAAAAAPIGCGAVITANTTLTSNVGPCNQGGLVVRGNGITLNLGGYTVSGKPRIGDGVGILLDHDTGSRVTNGTVTAFDAGVEVLGGGSNLVDAISATNNVGGARSDRNLGDGITVQESNGNTISGDTASGNGPYSGISVVDDATNPSVGSDSNVISNNTVVGNSVVAPGARVNQDDGIRIEGPNATNTDVSGNRVVGSGLDGIAVFADQGTGFANSGTTLDSNTIDGNGFNQFAQRKGDGIILFGLPGSTTILGADNTLVQHNSVTNNAANGVGVASQNNTIESNVATGNDANPGVMAFDLYDANTSPPCNTNTWSNNVFGTSHPSCIS